MRNRMVDRFVKQGKIAVSLSGVAGRDGYRLAGLGPHLPSCGKRVPFAP